MANYAEIIPYIQSWEGGWVNHPSDPGGETNKGVTYSSFLSLASLLNYDSSKETFLKMPYEVWAKIYKNGYWDSVKGDTIYSQQIANILADIAWGSGPFTSARLLKTTLYDLYGYQSDSYNKITEKDVEFINKKTLFQGQNERIFDYLSKERDDLLRSLPTFSVFGVGWIRRTTQFNQMQESNIKLDKALSFVIVAIIIAFVLFIFFYL